MWRLVPGLVITVLLIAPRPASADPFTAGQTLTVDFRSPGYPDVANTLYLALGALTVVAPVFGFTASLYDGERLLGTNSLHLFDGYVGPLHLGLSNVFVAPGTPRLNPSLHQTEVDFGSLRRGTIDGRVVFTIGAGAILLDLDNVALHVSQTLADGSGIPFISPSITSMEVAPVPEPGTLLLLGSGAGLAAIRRRRQTRVAANRRAAASFY